uniref:RPA1 related single stranded DNA binding protein, X-linked n=1 Tax=Salvator merianae TaxID=96440 RepID=A0A8D0DX07_SALMN
MADRPNASGRGAAVGAGGPSRTPGRNGGAAAALGGPVRHGGTAALRDQARAQEAEGAGEEVEGRGGVPERTVEDPVDKRGTGGVTHHPSATGTPNQDSWIQKAFEQVLAASHLSVSFPDAQPVTVLSLERYLTDALPPGPAPKAPPEAAASHTHASGPYHYYCYDITIMDGVCQEKCHLAPELNFLVYKNRLRCGLLVKITQCSYMYNEKRLCDGFLCIERLEILGASNPAAALQERKEYTDRPTAPLKGKRKHYLPLWNNEDPYGDIWVEKIPLQDAWLDESRLTTLANLEMSWRNKITFQPLLVRIMHKARLRYYGKPDTKLDMPYQAYFEVADQSGMMSMVLWNSLCPEWYNSMKIGSVLLLERYIVKTSYPFKTQPTPGDLHMKRFSTIEISLNVRDPATKIIIIPENKVKAEWKLPEVKYRFITRAELNTLPTAHSCDIIGLVQYVGRTERTRKKEHGEDFWIHRWVHAVDGTSEQPFILELFAVSQPDIFEQIHPMTYLVCTQMRVIRDTAEDSSGTIYLTTSNESQIFITGWHKGQPYTKDAKVKSFIEWMKSQEEPSHMEKAAIGGYYPFPPVSDTFMKYCNNIKVESVLTTISEMEKEIESLHYREHKRIAIQGIISAIRYVSCSNTSQDASGVQPMQVPQSECDQVKGKGWKQQRTSESSSVQKSPSVQQQQFMTRKGRGKRKLETAEIRNELPLPFEHSYPTRARVKKIILPSSLQENSHRRNGNDDIVKATQPCQSNKDVADVSEGVQTDEMCPNSWESALWTAVKGTLAQHLQYSSVFSESFPFKFNYLYKEVLMEQCNLQAAKWKATGYSKGVETNHFENPCPLEYYEVAILGLNHDIAVDVAYLPICCPEDSSVLQVEEAPHNVLLSQTTGASSQNNIVTKKGLLELLSFSDEGVKVAADLEKHHVICILDICSLGEDKVEVFLNKVYKVTDVDLREQT